MNKLRKCRTCGIEKELIIDNFKTTDGGKYYSKECRDWVFLPVTPKRCTRKINLYKFH